MTHEHKTSVLTDQEIDAVSGGGGGRNVAETNHLSGAVGASGNPKASAGPGYFFEPEGGPGLVPLAVHAVQGK
jgi:hypothetical protein